ncbi:TetR/AcrR family transcriptional regulator [Desulfovibrio ferrophilus]|uniref:TetR family transcriptional regulator n=1 Tax=Desulfovibrio ferrophilus TaxID=241368 RepID=A0A2Z6B3G2_9BACT|nr:TetR/AcrR family transcriptional regulator [Desulfovibrio ferrophilus]BBD09978.1 TetR family transcriptional regulator [Desulfovibrio ferrophilus]
MTKKESLLQAAKELFGEHGYNETTFKKISERAGVALGLLTHHYGNKEKLFMTAGLDVLEQLVARLKAAVAGADTGLQAVQRFCEEYLAFSIDPEENFLVLIRCSPYSDVKTREDAEVMEEKFTEVYDILEDCVRQGHDDGTIVQYPTKELATNVQCNLVGSVRTRLLTPYSPPSLYDDMLQFITRSLTTNKSV